MQLNSNYKRHALVVAGIAATLLGAVGCNPTSIEPVADPNNASLIDVLNNPTTAQINALAVGVEASLRVGHTNNAPNNQITGTLSREIIVLASNEPRWYGEILGTRGALGNNSFYSAGSYNAFARTIRASQVFRQSAQTAIPAVLDAAQKQGVLGYCDTYEALAKLHLLNLMGENGIRTDVANFLNPGKFSAGSAPALVNIRKLLDDGAAELALAGTDFGFPLSSGYAGFNTPATFLKFNRALAARVSLYQSNGATNSGAFSAAARTALAASFYNATGSLTLGPKLTFNPSISGDQGNTYYQVPNTGPSTLVTVPDNFTTEAEAGDLRLRKAVRRTAASRSLGGITGNYDPNVYSSQTAPLDIIRNEELVLISAEINVNENNFPAALADINAIRQRSGGLPVYSGPVTQTALINEILKQRRYSLFYEGHRWVDLRRLGRLSVATNPGLATGIVAPAQAPFPAQTLPYSFTGRFKIFDRLAKTFAEVAWDASNP